MKIFLAYVAAFFLCVLIFFCAAITNKGGLLAIAGIACIVILVLIHLESVVG